MIQVVTFLSPIVGGHLTSLWKGHFGHPKKAHKELPGKKYFPKWWFVAIYNGTIRKKNHQKNKTIQGC